MLDPSSFPIVFVMRMIDFGFSKERICIAVATEDPSMIGVGLSRDEAERNLADVVTVKYADDVKDVPPHLKGKLRNIKPDNELDEFRDWEGSHG